VGQSLLTQGQGDNSRANGDEESDKPEEPPADQSPAQPTSWERFILRTDEALEQFDRELRDLPSTNDERGEEHGAGLPLEHEPMTLRSSPHRPTNDKGKERSMETASHRREQAIDASISSLASQRAYSARWLCRENPSRVADHMKTDKMGFTHLATGKKHKIEISTSLALAAILGGWVLIGRAERRTKSPTGGPSRTDRPG
jgi:hypothetical protein